MTPTAFQEDLPMLLPTGPCADFTPTSLQLCQGLSAQQGFCVPLPLPPTEDEMTPKNIWS